MRSRSAVTVATPGTISISGRWAAAKHRSRPVGWKPGSKSRWHSTCRVVHSPARWVRSRWASMPASCRPSRSPAGSFLLRSSFTIAWLMVSLLSSVILGGKRHARNYAGGNRVYPVGTMLAVGRRFEFERDTFAFANELLWEAHFDEATGATAARRRVPAPAYALRCFVLVRAARQFLYHARFDPAAPPAPHEIARAPVRGVLARSPRRPSPPGERIVIPGFAGVRDMSLAREALLKRELGGAWRS